MKNRRGFCFRMLAIAGVCLAAGSAAGATTLEEALRYDGLAEGADVSTYVTVFNELEALDAAADAAWCALPDRASYEKRRRELQTRFLAACGGFPARTPLSARTVATCRKTGYRVEKVIFESLPGVFVTANFYLPENPSFAAPYPAVVMSCGHSENGKDAPTYARACVLAAKAGFAALMFDPYEQGERRVAAGHLTLCTAHTQIGLRAALLGGSMAQLRIWDGMRAIDYVQSRPEVDAARIGYMGNSGGGTMTALMMAADPRIRAAAPSCYLTTFTHLCEHIGPQDGEQNVFGQLAFGLNHAGFALIPDIPVAFTCKFSDFFTYCGTRQLFRTVRNVAARCGSAERYALLDLPGPHGWTEGSERGSLVWMRAWLRGERNLLPLDVTAVRADDLGFRIDVDADDFGLEPGECHCTPTGRTADLPGARSAFELMRDRLADALGKRPALPAAGPERAALVRRLAGIRTAAEAKPTFKVLKRETAGGCDVTHLTVLYPSGLALPAELVVKAGTCPKRAVVAISRNGRSEAFQLVRGSLADGTAVLVADLTGLGSVGQAPEGKIFYGRTERPEEGASAMLYLMGESMTGRRATDLLVLAGWLKDGGFGDVRLVAEGDCAIAAAHAAAAAPGLFASVETPRPAPAWREAFAARRDFDVVLFYSDVVNGALCRYDWPELLK